MLLLLVVVMVLLVVVVKLVLYITAKMDTNNVEFLEIKQ